MCIVQPVKLQQKVSAGKRSKSSMYIISQNTENTRGRNSPGFYPRILRHSGIWGAADEAVLYNVHKRKI